MNPDAPSLLASLLASQSGLDHLKIKKHGDPLLIFSEDGGLRFNRARLTALDRHSWGLSLSMFGGRCQRTPFVGTMQEVTGVLLDNFAGYLES